MKRFLALIAFAAVFSRAADVPVHLMGPIVQTFPDRGYVTMVGRQGPREQVNTGGARTAEEINAIFRMYENRWKNDNSEVEGFFAVRGLTNIAELGKDDLVSVWAVRTGVMTLTNAVDDTPVSVRVFTVAPPDTNAPPPPPVAKAQPAPAQVKPEPYKPAPLKPTITRNTKKKE